MGNWFRRATVTGTLVALAATGLAVSASADTPEVTLSVAPSTAQPGDQVTVTETVTNINGFTILGPTARLFSSPDALPGYATLTGCDAGPGGSCGAVTDGDGNPIGYQAVFGSALGGNSSFTATFTLTLNANDDSAVETLEGQLSGVNYGTGLVSGPTLTINAKADIAVGLTGTPQKSGLLGLRLNFTVTVTNNGPAAVRSASVAATVPLGLRADSASCTTTSGGAVCSFGTVPAGGKATATFSVPAGLLDIGLPFTFSAHRTGSSPTDPNPDNDSASTTCTVVSVLLASCR
ncbi:MAG TPA: hypothetical protein VHF06_12365 [Pseudonocardiaceae bacterium]|nr:hypothetical protein [Pseudonocardiaceae bacterium]